MEYESSLTDNEIRRYTRQIILPQVTPEGQIKLRNSSILIVGLGGLGSPCLMYLASCGIGKIGIVDYDTIEITNLNRQIIHKEENINTSKLDSAINFIKSLNSSITITPHKGFLSEDNINDIIINYDIIIDCTDNIKTRYIISDHCKMYNKDAILGSVLKWEGQVFVLPKEGPCYRCLFPEYKENSMNCDEAGVIGSVCGIIGSIQATETLKMILDLNKDRKSVFLVFDAIKNEYKSFDVSNKKNKDCLVCVKNEYGNCSVMKYIKPPPMMERLDENRKIRWSEYIENKNKYVLVDVRPKIWFDICRIKGSVNFPFKEIMKSDKMFKDLKKFDKKIAFLCKRGISARKVVLYFSEKGLNCCAIEGGLQSFKSEVDENFPLE